MNFLQSAGSVTDCTPAVQAEGGGSSPTPALQSYRFGLGRSVEVVPFIKQHHYSHSMSGVQYKYLFEARLGAELVGAAVFGMPASSRCWMTYGTLPIEIAELRRFVCIDDTPKNFESKFLGFCLRWLRLNSNYKKVVSYADPAHNHVGIIYKATNFKFIGVTALTKQILFEGRLCHRKSLHAGPKTDRRAYSFLLAEALKDGRAIWVTGPGKNIYLYNLK